MPPSAEDASALATPPMDVADPKRSEPHTDDFRGEEHTAGVAAGRLPEDVYTNYLSWWRAALRRKCVAVVERESEVIAKWQVRLFPPSLREAQTMGRSKSLILSFSCLCRRVSGRPG
jgi:hypothetical protein